MRWIAAIAVIGTLLGAPPTGGATVRPSASEQEFRQRLISQAKGHLGVPYRWGGESVTGVDCSGLVLLVARELGLPLGHRYTSASFVALGRPERLGIPIGEVQTGDLIAWPGHVAFVYENRNGRIRLLHAVGGAGEVVINDLSEYAAPGRVAIRTVRDHAFLLPPVRDWSTRRPIDATGNEIRRMARVDAPAIARLAQEHARDSVPEAFVRFVRIQAEALAPYWSGMFLPAFYFLAGAFSFALLRRLIPAWGVVGRVRSRVSAWFVSLRAGWIMVVPRRLIDACTWLLYENRLAVDLIDAGNQRYLQPAMRPMYVASYYFALAYLMLLVVVSNTELLVGWFPGVGGLQFRLVALAEGVRSIDWLFLIPLSDFLFWNYGFDALRRAESTQERVAAVTGSVFRRVVGALVGLYERRSVLLLLVVAAVPVALLVVSFLLDTLTNQWFSRLWIFLLFGWIPFTMAELSYAAAWVLYRSGFRLFATWRRGELDSAAWQREYASLRPGVLRILCHFRDEYDFTEKVV